MAYELQCLAKRIVSLCCSASGCERNWSIFSHVRNFIVTHLHSAGNFQPHLTPFLLVDPYQEEKQIGTSEVEQIGIC